MIELFLLILDYLLQLCFIVACVGFCLWVILVVGERYERFKVIKHLRSLDAPRILEQSIYVRKFCKEIREKG